MVTWTAHRAVQVGTAVDVASEVESQRLRRAGSRRRSRRTPSAARRGRPPSTAPPRSPGSPPKPKSVPPRSESPSGRPSTWPVRARSRHHCRTPVMVDVSSTVSPSEATGAGAKDPPVAKLVAGVTCSEPASRRGRGFRSLPSGWPPGRPGARSRELDRADAQAVVGIDDPTVGRRPDPRRREGGPIRSSESPGSSVVPSGRVVVSGEGSEHRRFRFGDGEIAPPGSVSVNVLVTEVPDRCRAVVERLLRQLQERGLVRPARQGHRRRAAVAGHDQVVAETPRLAVGENGCSTTTCAPGWRTWPGRARRHRERGGGPVSPG